MKNSAEMMLYFLMTVFFTASVLSQDTTTNQEIFIEKQPENISVDLGQNITLQCEFNVPVDCSWLRNGAAVKVSQRYTFAQDPFLINKSTDCSIEITNIQEVDIGKWQCSSLGDSNTDAIESNEIWITLNTKSTSYTQHGETQELNEATRLPLRITANGLYGMDKIAIDINQPLVFGCGEDDDRQSNVTLEFLPNTGDNWTEIVNDTHHQFVVNFGSYRCKACSEDNSEEDDDDGNNCIFSNELNVTKLNRHTSAPILLMNGMKIDELKVHESLHFNAVCVYNLEYGYPFFYWRFKGQHRKAGPQDDGKSKKISISLNYRNGILLAENPKELQCIVRRWLRPSFKVTSVLFKYNN